jgi:putative N6-adenine-specific DNA methylase
VIKTEGNFRMTATTMAGLEPILFRELVALGAGNPEQHIRAVSFSGDLGFMYKANLCLRTALRVIVPIKEATVPNESAFYSQIYRMHWEDLIQPGQTIAVRSVANSEEFTHTLYLSQKTKDAICDRLRHKFDWRPNVDTKDPDHTINIHIHGNDLSVGINSSGKSLHKRGYRVDKGLAPINEVLAAGIVQITNWDKRSTFFDPMTGSGTIAIEAALYAMNIPPGILREDFGFMNWPGYDAELYSTIFDACLNKIEEEPGEILASDLSPNMVRKAKKNIATAKMKDAIKCVTKDFFETEKPAERGVLVINPPYGERMDHEETEVFYKEIGDHLKSAYSGWDCFMITSELQALKSVGLRSSQRSILFNGSLECRLVKYEMYRGSQKEKS